ncbi:hypothetical protein SAMN05421780_11078 [Flexibacter flexilis DSM 6793]|uniref:Uncharacterized protein n=1 Tax=Flexibacter flexilis DSM 6793 TaxID=927664 RepID=A0A1I1M8L6_9BACT|nr:hypothetical protein SAMN05421780_11078 [Flexibacter flexilis DSM 6793]
MISAIASYTYTDIRLSPNMGRKLGLNQCPHTFPAYFGITQPFKQVRGSHTSTTAYHKLKNLLRTFPPCISQHDNALTNKYKQHTLKKNH